MTLKGPSGQDENGNPGFARRRKSRFEPEQALPVQEFRNLQQKHVLLLDAEREIKKKKKKKMENFCRSTAEEIVSPFITFGGIHRLNNGSATEPDLP